MSAVSLLLHMARSEQEYFCRNHLFKYLPFRDISYVEDDGERLVV